MQADIEFRMFYCICLKQSRSNHTIDFADFPDQIEKFPDYM